jgi:hypothetical protein
MCKEPKKKIDLIPKLLCSGKGILVADWLLCEPMPLEQMSERGLHSANPNGLS